MLKKYSSKNIIFYFISGGRDGRYGSGEYSYQGNLLRK